MTRRNETKAFTLIELLTVLAIIAVVLALVLPVLQRVRSCARCTACQSNLRQIALAWHAYLDDHNGCFYRAANNCNYTFGGWVGAPFPEGERVLNPYVGLPRIVQDHKQAKLFACPSDLGGSDYDALSRKAYGYFGNSYETNHLLIGPTVALPSWNSEPWQTIFARINETGKSIKQELIQDPARLLLVGDHNWRNQWDPLNLWYCGRPWHGKPHRYNLAFLDGHIDLIEIKKGICLNSSYRIHPPIQLNKLMLEKQEAVPCTCERSQE